MRLISQVDRVPHKSHTPRLRPTRFERRSSPIVFFVLISLQYIAKGSLPARQTHPRFPSTLTMTPHAPPTGFVLVRASPAQGRHTLDLHPNSWRRQLSLELYHEREEHVMATTDMGRTSQYW